MVDDDDDGADVLSATTLSRSAAAIILRPFVILPGTAIPFEVLVAAVVVAMAALVVVTHVALTGKEEALALVLVGEKFFPFDVALLALTNVSAMAPSGGHKFVQVFPSPSNRQV
ncbi:hypothetical protein GQX74_005162 [Glossina fuscipes]|nr:hypothetical protein GQX74_005162 [Glossina fuscipes]